MRRRDEILRTAAGLFASDGYTNTSMREVAAASGILAGSLYHHFESKEAIAVELVEAYHADLVRVVREFGSVPVDPLPALRAYAQAIAAVSFRHPAALQISVFDAPTTASSSLKTVVHAEPASVNRLWRTLISAAAAAGAIKDGVDLRILRYVLHRTTLNAGLLWGWQTPAGTQAAAECITALILDGLAPVAPASADSSKATRVVDDARARLGRRGRREPGPAPRSGAGRGAQPVRPAGLRGDHHARHRGRGRDHREQPLPVLRVQGLDDPRDPRGLLGPADGGLPRRHPRGLLGGGNPGRDPLAAGPGGPALRREIEILQGFKRLLDIGVADRYQAGAELRFGLLVNVIDSGVAAGELSQVAASDLVATCLREIMWSPMRNLAPISALRVRDFYRHSVLSGAAARD